MITRDIGEIFRSTDDLLEQYFSVTVSMVENAEWEEVIEYKTNPLTLSWTKVVIDTPAKRQWIRDNLYNSSGTDFKPFHSVRMRRLSSEDIEDLGFKKVSEVITPRLRGKEKDQFFFEYVFIGDNASLVPGEEKRLRLFTNDVIVNGDSYQRVIVMPGRIKQLAGTKAMLRILLEGEGLSNNNLSGKYTLVSKSEFSGSSNGTAGPLVRFDIEPNTSYILKSNQYEFVDLWTYHFIFYKKDTREGWPDIVVSENLDLNKFKMADSEQHSPSFQFTSWPEGIIHGNTGPEIYYGVYIVNSARGYGHTIQFHNVDAEWFLVGCTSDASEVKLYKLNY